MVTYSSAKTRPMTYICSPFLDNLTNGISNRLYIPDRVTGLNQAIAIGYIYNSQPMREVLDSHKSLHPCKPELLAGLRLPRKSLRYLFQFDVNHGIGFRGYQR